MHDTMQYMSVMDGPRQTNWATASRNSVGLNGSDQSSWIYFTTVTTTVQGAPVSPILVGSLE